jgi:glycosyltransferase involved in cell wall biosynthesis
MNATAEMQPPLVSVVVPVFQNARTVGPLLERIVRTIEGSHPDAKFEVVFVDDGSTDDSWNELLRLSQSYPANVALIKLVRNFGQVSALLAGFHLAAGRCCVALSADLQDPPELIGQMLAAWERDHKLVVAARTGRDDGLLIDSLSRAGWWMLQRYAVANIPKGGFDFFLMDRSVVDHFIHAPERNMFIQGRLLYYVAKPHVIYYERAAGDGRGQTRLLRRLKYFIDAFTSHSYLPMRLMSGLGLLMAFLAIVGGIVIVALTLTVGSKVEGWASLAVLFLLFNGVQLLCVGVLGEYLWRAVDGIRNRPHYIVETEISPFRRSADADRP